MQRKKPTVLITVFAILGILSMTACDQTPGDSTPVASDFNITSLAFIHDGNPKSVTITPKANKSNGGITVKYNGSSTLPTTAGTYAVTFDVAATTGWEEATGLSAGTLTIFDGLNDISSISTYLSAQSGGTTTANPVSLPVTLDLGTMTEATSNWQQLLIAINTTGKYVNLDLSACTLIGTEFGHQNQTANVDIKAGMNKIVFITLPTGVTSTCTGTFDRCTNLTSVTLPTSLTSIGVGAFQICSNLTQITMPASLTSIGSYAFNGCRNLTFNLSGTGSLSVIDGGKGLVRNNTELLAYPSANGIVSLPAGITSIDDWAFNAAYLLTSITLPEGLTSIGFAAFEGCSSLTQITLHASTTIGYGAFRSCRNLTFTITGTGSLSVIDGGKGLVRNNTELLAYPSASGDITLSTSITSISTSAFYGCSSLSSIILPAGITSIGPNAFFFCSSLTTVTCNAVTPSTLGSLVFNPVPSNIQVPAVSVEAYKIAAGWSAYADKISAIE